MTNISIIKNDNETITIDNLSHLSIGSKLIYIEYAVGNATRIRAFGKAEFDRVELTTPGAFKHDVSINLDDVDRLDMRFVTDSVQSEDSENESDVTSEPEQDGDDDTTDNLF